MSQAGFYGKVASRGDFVSRGLPGSFVDPWDQWLASGLHASQQQLGADWLGIYLVSPLWRFALAPGVCGPDAVAGVLMPSIDKVGRYFPLTIVRCLTVEQSLAAVVSGADDWFEQAENLLLATLEDDGNFESFEAGVGALLAEPSTLNAEVSAFAGLQRFAVTSPATRGAALVEHACLGASLWWGRGSQRIAAGLMRCQGLPAAADFGSYLLGQGVER